MVKSVVVVNSDPLVIVFDMTEDEWKKLRKPSDWDSDYSSKKVGLFGIFDVEAEGEDEKFFGVDWNAVDEIRAEKDYDDFPEEIRHIIDTLFDMKEIIAGQTLFW